MIFTLFRLRDRDCSWALPRKRTEVKLLEAVRQELLTEKAIDLFIKDSIATVASAEPETESSLPD